MKNFISPLYEIVNHPKEYKEDIINEDFIDIFQFSCDDDFEYNEVTGDYDLISKGWSQYHRHKLILKSVENS